MKPQIIQDSKGKETGVFLPIDQWNLIKNSYPDIEDIDMEIPSWQKELLDERLTSIQSNPARLKPIDDLLNLLCEACSLIALFSCLWQVNNC